MEANGVPFTPPPPPSVSAPFKQRKGGHVGAPTKSSGNLTLLLCYYANTSFCFR